MSLWWNLEDVTFSDYVPNLQRRHADVTQNLTYEIIHLDTIIISQHIEEVLIAKITNHALSLRKISNNILESEMCINILSRGVID